LKRFADNEVLYVERAGGEKVAFDFEQIYKEHFLDVYKYVLSISRDEALANEVTQETFFKAMQKIDTFKGECKLFVWLCQIAKNTYFTLHKKQKRYVSIDDTDIPTETDIETDYLDKEAAKRLHVLLHNLDEPYKEVFSLRVFAELPFSQIGELFGKTDSWARLIFYRAKKQLQEGTK
jgi:RNA polymerase sigma-70 factor (ECF subfamily)